MLFSQSAPHPALQDYIGQYIYVSFNTAILPSLKQTFFPYDIPAISFFIGPVILEDSKGTKNMIYSRTNTESSFAYFNALTTSPSNLYFQENATIKVFVIPFKPDGFSVLFPRDMTEITNQLPDFSMIAGASDGTRLQEQLVEANSFAAQVSVLDNYFLKRITHLKNRGEQVREACRRIIITEGRLNMKELAYHTNLSLRSLERQFIERIGVSPKMFARFKRFHHALSLINRQQPLAWTDIAYECGYYDQAHFCNEFKSFTSLSPSAYSPQECVLYNQIILYRNFAIV